MEGPPAIDGVRVAGNRWVACGLSADPVFTMPQATNVVRSNNSWS
jgi:hypothetical protein